MLDIKVVTNLKNDWILTTALCHKDGEWIYETCAWNQVSGTVGHCKKFSQIKQLEALQYHIHFAEADAKRVPADERRT